MYIAKLYRFANRLIEIQDSWAFLIVFTVNAMLASAITTWLAFSTAWYFSIIAMQFILQVAWGAGIIIPKIIRKRQSHLKVCE